MAEKVFIPGAVGATLHIEKDGEITVEHVQDVEPILDYAHAGRNHRFSGASESGFFHHVAEVPFVTLMEWAREAGCTLDSPEMSAVMERKLRDPAYAKLLAAPKVRDPRIILRGLR